MKTYYLIGQSIGTVIEANNALEAVEKAEKELLQGCGGWIEFCNEEDEEEYNKILESEEY